MQASPSFLYRNRCGIFCFQRRVPLHLRETTSALPELVRLSLRTRSKSVAKRLARTLSAMMDLRAKQYFKDEESYHRAMKLFQRFLAAQSRCSSFDELQLEFFDHLDDTTDHESELLTRASDYFKSKQLDTGKDPYAEALRQLNDVMSSHKISQPTDSGAISITLNFAFEEFLMNASSAWKKTSGMEDGYRTIYFPLFKELVGEVSSDKLTKAHVNEYIKLVQSLPANKTKNPIYREKSIRDFLDAPAKLEHRLSPITKKRYLAQMSRFFKWLRSNDYSMIDLDLPFSNVKISKNRSVDQQAAYTNLDIKKLFNSKQYTQGLHKQASHFWVPLIALYTGARLNEICQLSTADIKQDKASGRWVYDFNENLEDDPNKSLKKSFHARLVPVHARLIDLGFLKYIADQRKKKSKKLFPDLPYVRDANKYGDKLQRWFNRTYTQKSCGISTKNTSFHSLRHTVITHLVNEKQVDANQIAVGMGQTPQGGVTQTTYTKRSTLTQYIDHFDKIDFDNCYDYKLIRRWDRHTFSLPLSNNGTTVVASSSPKTSPKKTIAKKTATKKVATKKSGTTTSRSDKRTTKNSSKPVR